MRKRSLTLIILSLLLIAFFGSRVLKQEPLYHAQSYVFGTLVDISIYGESETRAKALTDKILQDFQNLHNQLHAWKPISKDQPSELGALNAAFAAGKAPMSISPSLAGMLSEATDLSVRSQGLFNPAIGHLVSLWGFHRDTFSAVSIDDQKINALVTLDPHMQDIVIQGNTAYSKNPHVKLDLGGYAKGYALDSAVDYLRAQQVNNALVNIGGNIIALGKHGEQPWRVGIQHPRKPGAIATLALADGWAIGTSGDYQRYFMLNGKRYCHIIDPRTGYPVQHTQAVTVLIPPQAHAGVLSDVASKPIFIAAKADKRKVAATLGIEYFMVIAQEPMSQNPTVRVSAPLAPLLDWLEPEVKMHHHVEPITQP